MSKKVLILEGLCCANCATKIDYQVNNLSGVKNAYIDFISKKLVIEANNIHDLETVIQEAKKIVKKIEPDVNIIIEEDKKESIGKQVFIMDGLGCAGCLAKMELGVKSLDGIKEATIDFVSKKLKVEFENSVDKTQLFNEISKVVTKYEPEVELVLEKSLYEKRISNQDNLESSEKKSSRWVINKNQMLRLGVGTTLFIIGLIFELSFAAELTVFLVSYFLVGGEVLLKSAKNISRGQVFDENFLMSVATIGAFAIQEFPEGVAVMLFYQIGEFFQNVAVNRSRKSIQALMDIRPDYANLIEGSQTKRVDPEDVIIGDRILVKPGEKVPLDGRVMDGSSMLDTSALTGESVPREVTTDDAVLAGFINKNGVLTIEVTKEFGESTVSKILDLVQNASSKKAPTEKFITKFARYYTPAVVFVAAILAIIPPLVIEGATFQEWIYRALVFLVVSCPCALVISIPLGFFGGIGGASRNGVLIKGSNYLEALNNVDVVVFDKTGTLTKGVFKVTTVEAMGQLTNTDLLEYAAYAESFSNHPIATSIVKAFGNEINKGIIEDYNELPGYGIKVIVKGNQVLAGNFRLMDSEKIEYPTVDTVGTIVHIAVNNRYEGYIIISDEVKEDSAKAIAELKKLGVKKTIMLTGDIKKVGEKVASILGLDEVYTELLPDQKVMKFEEIKKNKANKGKIVFVGDGINDAPVLSIADIGIAMGGLGSDAAIEAADVVIMNDEPSKLATAIRVAKKTRKIIWQNIIFAFTVKIIVIVLGAGGLATMWEAVFADVGVTVVAVFNSMRVMNVKNL